MWILFWFIIIAFSVVVMLSLLDKAAGKQPKRIENQPKDVEKPKPEIGEPVLSFIETYKKNPKRFRIKELITLSSDIEYGRSKTEYILEDKEKGLKFSLKHEPCRYGLYEKLTDYFRTGVNTGFLNRDEIAYIYEEIRHVRLERRKANLNKRNTLKRNRLIKVYYKENQE